MRFQRLQRRFSEPSPSKSKIAFLSVLSACSSPWLPSSHTTLDVSKSTSSWSCAKCQTPCTTCDIPANALPSIPQTPRNPHSTNSYQGFVGLRFFVTSKNTSIKTPELRSKDRSSLPGPGLLEAQDPAIPCRQNPFRPESKHVPRTITRPLQQEPSTLSVSVMPTFTVPKCSRIIRVSTKRPQRHDKATS